jgi:hypothetical protein
MDSGMLGIDTTKLTYDCRRLTEPAVTPLPVLPVAVALNIVKIVANREY